MVLKLKIFLLLLFSFFFFSTFANDVPKINCVWLAWCVDSDIANPSEPSDDNNMWLEMITNIIWELIQFVAVISVITLIISWMMYIIFWWDEEKLKKAKSWIIWSLVWTLLSISAWWIIEFFNNLNIT